MKALSVENFIGNSSRTMRPELSSPLRFAIPIHGLPGRRFATINPATPFRPRPFLLPPSLGVQAAERGDELAAWHVNILGL